MQLLLFIIIVLIVGGILRSNSLKRSKNQVAFLAGCFPEAPLDGFHKGTVRGFNGGWKGKVFHAAQNSGINILEDEEHKEHEKYPFQTYKAKGLQDQEKEVLCLDYSSKQNPWWVRPILDEVVQVEPGKYLGKMHVRIIPGFPFTVLFFRLEKPVS